MKRGEQPFGQSVFSYLLWLCRGFPSACGIRKTRTVGRTQPGGGSDFDAGTGRDRVCLLARRQRGFSRRSSPVSEGVLRCPLALSLPEFVFKSELVFRGMPSGKGGSLVLARFALIVSPSGRSFVRRGSLEKGDGVVFGDMASSFFRVPPSSPWHFDSHFPYFSASNLAIQVCTSVASCVARSVVNKTIRQSGENAAKTCLCTILTPLRCGPFSARL